MILQTIKSLVGGKITKEITAKDINDEDCEGFQVVNNGKIFNYIILGDEEGNYPGCLEINEVIIVAPKESDQERKERIERIERDKANIARVDAQTRSSNA